MIRFLRSLNIYKYHILIWRNECNKFTFYTIKDKFYKKHSLWIFKRIIEIGWTIQ